MQQQAPFVHISINPKAANDKNPNGIVVASNMKGKGAEYAILQMLAETIYIASVSLQEKGPMNVSDSILMPDGSPAPLG